LTSASTRVDFRLCSSSGMIFFGICPSPRTFVDSLVSLLLWACDSFACRKLHYLTRSFAWEAAWDGNRVRFCDCDSFTAAFDVDKFVHDEKRWTNATGDENQNSHRLAHGVFLLAQDLSFPWISSVKSFNCAKNPSIIRWTRQNLRNTRSSTDKDSRPFP
jgi:hypothetical protein